MTTAVLKKVLGNELEFWTSAVMVLLLAGIATANIELVGLAILVAAGVVNRANR